MADDAVQHAGPRIGPMPAQACHPGFGLESLERMGIDIDQDPRAFARFLELKNLIRRRSAAQILRRPQGRR